MFRLYIVSVVLLAACSLSPAEVDAIPPTATTVRVIQSTLVPTMDRQLQPINTITPAPTTPIHPACEATEGLPSAQHMVQATVDYEAHQVEVEQAIFYVNRTDSPLSTLVLDIEPNRVPNAFTLASVLPTETVLSYELTGRRLTLDLATPVEPDCGLDVTLNYSLRVPEIQRGLSGFTGYFGFSIRQLNLGHWLAMVAVHGIDDWVTHDAIPIGEQTVAEIADWDVTLTLENAPPNMVIAAPGTVTQSGTTWHFVHPNSRDFTLSLSPFYDVFAQETANGVTVQLYAFGENIVGAANGSQQALTAAAQALEMYADLFGAYPYERFVVVQGDFPDGMEFSDLVFVSDRWFEINTGTAESYLTFITVHETSHQWWYARVGSDQALVPWLDEALATYSELVYYEEFEPDLVDWWWNFRVNQYVGDRFSGNNVDSTVYQFASIRDYINAVYLRGAIMLDDLREVLGTEVFFDWLRRYADAGANRIVTPDDFWSLLTPEEIELVAPIRVEYFGSP